MELYDSATIVGTFISAGVLSSESGACMKNSLGDTFPFSLAQVQDRVGPALAPASFVIQEDVALWLEVGGQERRLAVLAPQGHALLVRFEGQSEEFTADYTLLVCKADQ